jgi:glutamate-1-semialdehyde aminotransferase
VAQRVHSTTDPAGVRDIAELVAQARSVLPYDRLDRIADRPLFHDEGVFPQFAESAQGCEIVDALGRSYIDWFGGWGPVLLGYRHPAVEEAVKAQMTAGPMLSFMHPVEVEVATILTEMVPCAEMVAFGKNGSDVVTAAVRLCRAITGRNMILQHGFHGFHDWYTCMAPGVRGIPEVLRDYVHPFPYNDLQALEELFRRFRGQVAGIVMEPMNTHHPEPGYLKAVKDLAHENGALLVFDEMVVGFRLANGGGQEYLGVTPDLATFGKALANGMPLSAICGKREYMKQIGAVGYGMTFRCETLSLAAARAVLETLREEPVVDHLADVGRRLRIGFEELSARHEVRCELLGPDARLTFAFSPGENISWETLRNVFTLECMKNGVLHNGNLLPSYAHDDEAIERTLAAFDVALAAVAAAADAARAGNEARRPTAPTANGYIEVLGESGEALEVVGWLLVDDEAPDEIEVVAENGDQAVAERVERPDLEEGFPTASGARYAGFQSKLPAERFCSSGHYEFTLRARRGDHITFQCLVVRDGRFPGAPPYWIGDGVLFA